jgi:hypothetical protein
MTEPYGFDPQAWRAGQQAEALRGQTLADNALKIQQDELALRASQRAELSQLELVDTLKRNGAQMTVLAQEDPAKAMAVLSGMMARSGDIAGSAEIMGKAALANEHSMIAAEHQTKTTLAHAAYTSNALRTVHDDESLKVVALALLERFPEDSPYIQKIMEGGYDKTKIDALIQASTSLEAKSKIELAAARETQARAQAALSDARRTVLVPAQAAAARERAAATRKSGGVKTQALKEDARLAANLIQGEYAYDPTEDKDELVLASAELARRTKELQVSTKKEKGPAMREAYAQMKNEGFFAGKDVAEKVPGTYASPLPFPESKEDMVENKVYEGAGKYAGKLFVWRGGKLVQVQPKTALDFLGGEEETPGEEGTPDEEEE